MKVFVAIPKNSDIIETFVTKEVQEYLSERFEVSYSPFERNLNKEEFSEMVKDCDAVITGWGNIAITYDMLKDTKVKVIAHTGGTVANVADASLFDNGIHVISGNKIYAESVAEGTIGYMLTALRKIPFYIDLVRDGGWHGDGYFSEGLLDKTIGIVGMGTISGYLIKMLQMFRGNIKIFSSHEIDKAYLDDNNATQVSLEEIFSTCDIVSVHSAMNEKTRGMIGKEHFDLLKDGALFINTARGAVVREDEMIEALKENRFFAFLDVYCTEPLPLDSELRSLKNIYAMPHMGGPTLDRRAVVTKRLADSIIKIYNGEESELEISKQAASRMTVGA